jgi:hypothetical protein
MPNESNATGSLWLKGLIRFALWGTVAIVVEFALLTASVLLDFALGCHGLVEAAIYVAFLGLGLVVLAQLSRGAVLAVGWVSGGVLCGALLGSLDAPTISDGYWRQFWAAEYTLGGAVSGMVVGVIVSIVACQARFLAPRLIELAVACALLIAFWEVYSEAGAGLQRREVNCCLKALGVALLQYAQEHDGRFPAGAESPEASLSLLARGHYDVGAETLCGNTVPIEKVGSILERGEPLGPDSCGWHYVEGLTTSDDARLALVWDKVGLGHNGEATGGGHSVLFSDIHVEAVAASDWPGFLRQQEDLMAARPKQADQPQRRHSADQPRR